MNQRNLTYLLILALAIIIPLLAFQRPQPKTMDQNNPYEKEWKEIDSLESEGLPRSALKKVEALYERAKADEEHAQLVKTIIHKGKYNAQLTEEGMAGSINMMREELEKSGFPVQPVLHSLIAEMYQRYADDNYWKLRDRTNTIGFVPEDLESYSLEQLLEQAAMHYMASVENEKTVELPIGHFAAITYEGTDSIDVLRPTLYDFLAHRAVDHFTNERSYLTQPANRFLINDPEAFAAAEEFVDFGFTTSDSTSYQFKTLRVFQKLLKLRLAEEKPEALLDADLKRLKFVKQKTTLSNGDSLYLQALNALEKRYAKTPEVAEVWYYMAKHYQSLGNQYTPEKEQHKWKLKEALELCDKAIARYADSYGSQLAKRLKSELAIHRLSAEVETVNRPDQAILASVVYRNLSTAYFRLIKLDEDQRFMLSQKGSNDVHEILLGLPALRDWKVKLPDDGDLQEHRTEIGIEGLPFGEYALLISNNENFTIEDNASGYLYITVSNMGYLSRRLPAGKVEMVVVDRYTGEPLEGVKTEYYRQEYNRRKRQSERKKIGEGRTDENGMVRPDVPERTNYQVRFSKGDDVLFFNDGYSHYSRTDYSRDQMTTHFFTDRSIYRPGQAIYFKAIVLNKDKEQRPAIVPNEQFTVTLFDVNRQEVAKLDLKTNEYGTANGVFTAPKGGLLGQMHLSSSVGGREFFSVEEYKRPKFEVTFDALEGTPELNEEVMVSGSAKAFAGSSVDGAEVNYRVVREVQYPWWPWWRWSRPGPNSGQSQEIASGGTNTDADGSFEITFNAKPDLSVDKDDKPEFIFTVYADVVDITGETRSASKQVRLAYLGLKTDLMLPESFDQQGGVMPVGLVAQNLDGEAQPTEGTLTVNRLEAPQRLLVDRFWDKPDRYLLKEEEFVRQFPHLAYKTEDQKSDWKKTKQVYELAFNTAEEDSLMINTSGLAVGHYEFKMRVEDDKGNEIEAVKYLAIYDSGAKQLPAGTVSWQKNADQDRYQPGETVNMLLGSSDKQFHFLYELERKGELLQQEWKKTGNWQEINYQVKEEDRGNIYAHFSMVKFGRPFLWHQNIYVPWSNKELDIQFSTFRDKLKPGQEEAWQITIKGPGNEQVAAEMAAAMYDASLDQFRAHDWRFSPFPTYYSRLNWRAPHFNANGTNTFYYGGIYPSVPLRNYRRLNWFGLFYASRGRYADLETYSLSAAPAGRGERMADQAAPVMAMEESEADTEVKALSKDSNATPQSYDEKPEAAQETAPPVRKNLKETVFFFPELRTDEAGNIILKFTMNEALTRWKLLGFAHTKELEYALTEREVVTQKELMVLPNPPRFFREGDRIVYTAKVSNLTEETMKGEAKLQLFNALTMEPVDEQLGNKSNSRKFTAEAGQSAPLSWELNIPEGEVMAITHRVVAEAGNFSDGEESVLPVLTNRTMVTETMPLPLKGGETRTFTFEAMDKAQQSGTLQHHSFTLEFTSNPAWYAVKALPYLMDYPHECTEQIFSRYYANSLATSIANSHPAIQRVFEQWQDADALVSELEQNQELKSLLLEETPWVLQAQSETEQRKRIGLLFDLNRMAYEQDAALSQIAQRQAANGGFSWFPGGRESWYITQYMLEGFGRLRSLGVKDIQQGSTSWNVVVKAARFVDVEMVAAYEELMRRIEQGKVKKEDNHLSSLVIHYLYARSLFPEIPLNDKAAEAAAFYRQQAGKYWLSRGLYEQGLIALAMHNDDKGAATPQKIVKSLRERALYNEELGMYWKTDYGYFWHQLPIETHSLMVEVFAQVAADEEAVEQLKIWLLKNKQTTHWKTTKATANAVYALLRFGDNWLMGTELAEVSFPELEKSAYQSELSAAKKQAEAGTGYFKTSWGAQAVSDDFRKITVQNPNDAIAWGAAYWQYFEDLDKVDKFEDTPLKLSKKLFVEVNGAQGPELVPAGKLNPGDKLMVRIELEVDRAMEYVHLKDHRASGLEPINVLSRYKWQGGLGYYESTKDAATHFFMDYLPKGKYVFEYPLRVVHRGDFSNGLASIQCMYAPEFTSHSEGQRIEVE